MTKHRYETDEARWQAVRDKEADAAHAFYYGVRTTGVFCIAGCSSRRPNPDNVVFFDTVADALAQDYRPCKRCRPDDTAHADIASRRIVAACRAIETAQTPPSLAELAGGAELSPAYFQRLFKEQVGVSPKVYAQAVRDERVRRALTSGASVTQAVFDAGYGSASRFHERSAAALGMTATRYKAGGAGLKIRYALAQSHLGPLLAGFTDLGVCAILFGDTPDELIHDLRQRFHAAHISPGGSDLDGRVARLVAFIESPTCEPSLPLDIQGTAFQQRVWKALQNIPPGQTRTYTDVAQAIGQPNAARAVAKACADNPLAVAVPCHRVLRKDGSLAGYRWGLERKAALLEREREDA